MFAKRLESFLTQEVSKTGLSARAFDDVPKRFEALRGCALLPRGRRKNSTPLSLREIAAAVLSIVTAQPGWAGFGASGLIRLHPVGGVDASFEKCPTFGAVIETILSIGTAREKLVEVRLSDSEVYTNSYCRASVIYTFEGRKKIAYYVSEYAISLTQPGAEQRYDPTNLISTVTAETVLYRSFFNRLSREIERKLPPPLPDPEEEDEETRKRNVRDGLGSSRVRGFST
jgi:hypothetical protein